MPSVYESPEAPSGLADQTPPASLPAEGSGRGTSAAASCELSAQSEPPAQAELSEKSDVALVRSLAAGNSAALAALYDRHVGDLLTLAQRLLGSRSDAEDLVHDLFLEVWQRAGTYDPGRASVRTWLMLRLRSRALDRLKSAAWRLAASSKPLSGPEAAPSIVDAGLSTAPDQELMLRATQSSVHGAMRLLTADEQQLLELVYVRGITLAAAAGELDTPLGTVKSRLNRVLGKLRSSLAQLCEV